MLRQNRPQRNIRYKQELRTDVPSGSDVKEDYPHLEAVTQLIPQIQARTRNAIRVDRVEVVYYQRVISGRRCSCYTGGETSPDGLCQICWGTGVVGGYNKYGTRTSIIDYTTPGIRLVNVHPAFELNTRPILFALDSAARYGYLEANLDLMANRQIVDALQVITPRYEANSSVLGLIKTPSEINFVPLTSENLTNRLNSDNIVLKVELRRIDTTIQSPLFSHLLLRYNLLDDIKLLCDQPTVSESTVLTELGTFDQMSTVSFIFDNSLGSGTTQDFLIRLRDMQRFKVVEINTNAPEGLLTSTTVTGRLVQQFDSYSRII